MKRLISLAVIVILLSSCDIDLDSSKSWTTSRLEGIYGTGWINNHEIEFVQSVKIGTDEHLEPKYKDTMGIKDIISEEIRGEKPAISYDIYAASPDGRHIYVKQNLMENENLIAEHRIISRDGGETKEVANPALAGSAVWLDNEHILYMGGIGDNGAVQIDLQGNMTPIPTLNQWMVPNNVEQVTRIGERMYFLNGGRLSYIEMSQLDNPVLHTVYAENVNRFYPSQDGHQIAVVSTVFGSLSKPDRMKSELLLLDLDGKPLGEPLETGNYFNSVSWSLDQSKLTYMVAKHYPDKYEVHVLDLKRAENKTIYKSGNQVASSELLWSPDSKQMMFTVNRAHSTLESKPETMIYKFN